MVELKQKGILTEEEYKTKIGKIEAEKIEQDLKNSKEYQQLKSLYDSGILTKEEFDNKVDKINKLMNKPPEKNTIETYDFDITLINNESKTVSSVNRFIIENHKYNRVKAKEIGFWFFVKTKRQWSLQEKKNLFLKSKRISKNFLTLLVILPLLHPEALISKWYWGWSKHVIEKAIKLWKVNL